MLSAQEAFQLILETVKPASPEQRTLFEAWHCVLAEGTVSDLNIPPFDKALMDGFAVKSSDCQNGKATLQIQEIIYAGSVPTISLQSGQTSQIMTGAPLPEGADAVVQIEHCQIDEAARSVKIDTGPVSPGKNMLPQSSVLEAGAPVLAAGTLLRPQEIGALAETGSPTVKVRRAPTVAILATGDELVAPEESPEPGQIRNSNEVMLHAQILQTDAKPQPLGIARDERNHLRSKIQEGLKSDFLLLSGGISAGERDLVPSELEQAGVKQVFHMVNLKPGKPLWFGILERSDGDPCYIFGLPGNPVSSMVCFELFVRTAIRQFMGFPSPRPQVQQARLKNDYHTSGNRPTYQPARLEWEAGESTVSPLITMGSADLNSTVKANAVALFPTGNQHYQAGLKVDVFLW
ncbi:gephyrin-like molybdotransferase Glp [Gimesia maris]|uniref:molybdopterin molybdotransferase MoeA n=1 Tax=Gimesia maris TaxID=122 RepID=UPI00241EC788|nr:gephyrin-like molybdotransferase Glp [Gimesia maris]|tara:strand:- start:51402 stop:52616 length:1215 start_codon:yes stop_codon:yes gene_type:complete